MWIYITSSEKMTPVRLLKNFSDLYAYSFWKVCYPVRLLKSERLLETLEYWSIINIKGNGELLCGFGGY